MKYSLTIRKEAELDINSAFEYCEIQRLGLGHDFLLCVEEALSKIERNPTHYKITHKELRRIAVHRFPYRVFYLIQNKQVIVTAVFHARKDPQSWDCRS
ncbi:MAG: type II toxin-antitoxin system RelE/ParE family toxin [Methylococcaceae bacterium]|jgi:plasmid stabilization system protein ParE